MTRVSASALAVALGVLVLCAASAVSAAHHAVLVCGSSSFENYRHHADIAHAYNILLNHGIPSENIIVMMYNDVPFDSENPYPGKLFNHPTAKGTPGIDVYAAVKDHIDYTKDDVKADNFVSVIKGDAAAMKGIGTGRVLNSTAADDVFIYFADHGGTDIIAFPFDELHRDTLIGALTYMHNNSMYANLVFYMEACESGSMFHKVLTTDLNIYAVTAANTKESSYAWYCDDQAVVNGKDIGSCLGDEFSIHWMEDSDLSSVNNETLQAQFLIVKNHTTESHVMQYGSIAPYQQLPVVQFIGDYEAIEAGEVRVRGAKHLSTPAGGHGVRAEDAKLHSLFRRYQVAQQAGDLPRAARLSQQLSDELATRTKMDRVFSALARKFAGHSARFSEKQLLTAAATDFADSAARTSCYRSALASFRAACGRNDYSAKYTRVLSNVCARTVAEHVDAHRVSRAVDMLCHEF